MTASGASAPAHGAEALTKIALAVAEEASRVLMAGYRSRPVANEKARRDLVTQFDLESDALIRARLAAETPEIAIVAEESGGAASDVTWYVDPLDGTMNFVHGHPFFAVSIGAVDRVGPLAGVVVAPALGVTWTGYRGGLARRNGVPCAVSENTDFGEALLATGFPADREHSPSNNLDTFCLIMKQVRGVRRCGSAAIDCCMVADGTFDGYWERKLHYWDLAAGAAIALAAGGRLTSLTGGPPDLGVGHIALTNGLIHEALVAALQNVPG